jgi:hypothetical protein
MNTGKNWNKKTAPKNNPRKRLKEKERVEEDGGERNKKKSGRDRRERNKAKDGKIERESDREEERRDV